MNENSQNRFYACLNCSDIISCIPNSYENMIEIQRFLIKHSVCKFLCLLTDLQIEKIKKTKKDNYDAGLIQNLDKIVQHRKLLLAQLIHEFQKGELPKERFDKEINRLGPILKSENKLST